MSFSPPPVREPWLVDAVGRLISIPWIQWFQRLTTLDVIDTVYPVGSIYVSVLSTNPADLFKRGTWVAFGAGRTLVSLDAADADFDTAEETGGAKTQTPSTHTGLVVANHDAHTHAIPEMAHGAVTGDTDAASAGATGSGATASTLTTGDHTHGAGTLAVPSHAAGTTGNPSATLSHTVVPPADHAAISTLPPFITVYMFKRVS